MARGTRLSLSSRMFSERSCQHANPESEPDLGCLPGRPSYANSSACTLLDPGEPWLRSWSLFATRLRVSANAGCVQDFVACWSGQAHSHSDIADTPLKVNSLLAIPVIPAAPRATEKPIEHRPTGGSEFGLSCRAGQVSSDLDVSVRKAAWQYGPPRAPYP